MVVSTNSSIFKEGMGADAKPLGITIGKKDELFINFNLYVDLRIKESGESIRHFYVPFEV